MPKIADIEATPNPNAMRFILKERLTWGVPRSFDNEKSAQADQLASRLFTISNVTNVYYMDNWITVTQDGGIDWPDLLQELAIPIREAAAAIKPDVIEAANIVDDNPQLAAIRKLLNEHVRPALIADGGDIQIIGLNGNTLTIRYFGACGTCPSSLDSTLGAIKYLTQSINPDLEVIVV